MTMVMAVVLILKSSAWIATGDAMAYQASRSTVHTSRLRIGRHMKPTIKPRAAMASADVKNSPFVDSRVSRPIFTSRDGAGRLLVSGPDACVDMAIILRT